MDRILEGAENNYFRAYGIFSEPSAVAKFLLPGFALSLFGWNDSRKTDIRSLILISTAILITTSLQGLVISAAIFVYYLFAKEKKVKGKRYRAGKNISIILILLIVVAFYFSGAMDGVLARLNNISPDAVRPGSSNAIRLYRGFAVFGETPLFYKIIGCGYGNAGGFVISQGITTRFDGDVSNMAFAEYMNGISTILVCVGLIGFLIFARLIISLYKQSSIKYRAILIAFIILQFSGGGMFSNYMVYYFAILYVGIERKVGVNKTDELQKLEHPN